MCSGYGSSELKLNKSLVEEFVLFPTPIVHGIVFLHFCSRLVSTGLTY